MNSLFRSLRLALLFALLGCPSPSQRLHIDVVTDLVPQIEFDAVRLIVTNGPRTLSSDHIASSADYVQGQRLGSLEVTPAPTRVTVQLFRSGSIVLTRVVVVDLGASDQSISVLLSRDCRGVQCPDSAAASLEACLGGRCVDPHCSPETPELCPLPDCTENDDCSVSACALPVCRSGVCFAQGETSRCEAEEYCDGTLGCRLRPTDSDVGLGDMGLGDAAPDAAPDAALEDAGVDAPGDAGPDAGTCPAGFRTCPGDETPCLTNTQSDAAHCGVCGNRCADHPNVNAALCLEGVCTYTECSSDAFRDCDERPGCETDVRATDANNCGSCGNVCAAPAVVCSAGVCGCPPPADHVCGDACVEILVDVSNCGVCGQACDTAAGEICNVGGCICAGPEEMLCGGLCIDTTTAPMHCGGCDRPCVPGLNSLAECLASSCMHTCTAGFADCDANPEDCETDTSLPTSCGGCTPCPTEPNATSDCVGLSCGPLTCTPPFFDCNEDLGTGGDGCESPACA